MGIWSYKESFNVEISEKMDIEKSILIDKGFSKCFEFYKRCVDLTSDLVSKPVLPDGFKIISMETPEHYKSQRILRAHAFSGQDNLTE